MLIEAIKKFKRIEKLQEKCKHKRTETLRNSGDYKLRISCRDCRKVLKYEFKKKFKKYKLLNY